MNKLQLMERAERLDDMIDALALVWGGSEPAKQAVNEKLRKWRTHGTENG